MKRMMTGTLFATALLASPVWAEGSVEEFMNEAIEANLTDIELGKLAQQNGGTEAVKAFGQTLQTTHSAANVEAIRIAAAKGVKVPTAPDKDQQKELMGLKKYAGAEFDKRFVPLVVDNYQESIEEYQEQSKRLEDGEAATYAQQNLPMLFDNMKQAMALKGKGGFVK